MFKKNILLNEKTIISEIEANFKINVKNTVNLIDDLVDLNVFEKVYIVECDDFFCKQEMYKASSFNEALTYINSFINDDISDICIWCDKEIRYGRNNIKTYYRFLLNDLDELKEVVKKIR